MPEPLADSGFQTGCPCGLVPLRGERGVPFYTAYTIRETRGRVGEIESVVLVQVDGELKPVSGSEREIACDTVCLALGLAPNVELLHLVGARLVFDSTLGGWIPELDDQMQTSIPMVFAVGDCAGVHDGMLADQDIARSQGRAAGLAAAESLGARRPQKIPLPQRGRGLDSQGANVHTYWQQWLQSLIHAGGWEVNVCQCEEVTRRELVEVKPPRYLKWESLQMGARSLDTMLSDGPINQDQIKRLTRAGMGPCQGRRCREQVALLLAQAARTPVERIPLPFGGGRPPAGRRPWSPAPASSRPPR